MDPSFAAHGTLAEVYQSPIGVVFGPDFFKASLAERGITMIHELTHLDSVYGTIAVGERYGTAAALTVAASGPTAALANGDNWAYLASSF